MTLTYNKTTIKNKLEISYENCSSSPREWSNILNFSTWVNRVQSIDDSSYEDIITSLYQSEFQNENKTVKEFIDRLRIYAKEEENIDFDEFIGIIDYRGYYSVYNLDNLLTSMPDGIATLADSEETFTDYQKFINQIKSELEVYNKWANGEVYEFLLYDDNGEVENSVCGFYDIEDIREHLPEEYKNEDLNKYFINK